MLPGKQSPVKIALLLLFSNRSVGECVLSDIIIDVVIQYKRLIIRNQLSLCWPA